MRRFQSPEFRVIFKGAGCKLDLAALYDLSSPSPIDAHVTRERIRAVVESFYRQIDIAPCVDEDCDCEGARESTLWGAPLMLERPPRPEYRSN